MSDDDKKNDALMAKFIESATPKLLEAMSAAASARSTEDSRIDRHMTR